MTSPDGAPYVYEYGVAFARDDILHRGPMSEAEARQWVHEWEAEGGREGAFIVIRRECGRWAPHTNAR